MVNNTVYDSGSEFFIMKDLVPFGKLKVSGNDEAFPFIAIGKFRPRNTIARDKAVKVVKFLLDFESGLAVSPAERKELPKLVPR